MTAAPTQPPPTTHKATTSNTYYIAIIYRQTYLLLKLKLDTKINSIVVWWCLMPMACYSFFLSILNWRSRLSGRFLCVLENKRRIIGCLVEICFIMSLYFSISYFYHDQAHYHPFQNHYNFFYIAFEVEYMFKACWLCYSIHSISIFYIIGRSVLFSRYSGFLHQ
jgi:hypothetical protein